MSSYIFKEEEERLLDKDSRREVLSLSFYFFLCLKISDVSEQENKNVVRTCAWAD